MNRAVPILTYHSIDRSQSVISASPKTFDSHVCYMIEHGYKNYRLLEIVECLITGNVLPNRAFVITFDDGYKNNLDEALPVLTKYRCTATIFITTAYVGKANAWPDQHQSIPKLPMMTWEEIRTIRNAGIDIGAHSVNHPYLPHLQTEPDIRNEIVDSQKQLADQLGENIPLFSYPYGQYDARSRSIVTEFFDGAISNWPDLVTAQSDRFALERLNTTSGLFKRLPLSFLAKNSFQGYVQAKRWLRFVRSLVDVARPQNIGG